MSRIFDCKTCRNSHNGLPSNDIICYSCIDGNCYEAELSAEFKVEREADVVKEPSHYKHGRFETIDEMIIVFGPQRTYDYCIMNAWKYRSRAPFKGNPKQDMEKADYYLELAKQIQEANKELFYGSFNLIKEGKNVKAE